MASEGIRNIKGVVSDIADGYISVNPLFLKTFKTEELKGLNEFLEKRLREVRTEQIVDNDLTQIRKKNMRLQRLNLAITVLKNYIKEKRISLVEKKNIKKGLKDIKL
ncbi:MAG: hypothetical protein N2738_06635 [Thermodesulfovibrionales bacterium]|nr:hypothetical protein [Thermodesulfovibrionales bacterium]